MMKMLSSLRNRLEQFAVFFLCSIMFLMKGGAKRASLPPRNVLVYQGMKLGDMVCTTPIFRAIKNRYPSCKVTVAGNGINKELLSGNADVDGYIVLEKSIWKNRRLLRKSPLRKEGFDFACLVGTNFSSLAALYLAGIPAIAAQKVENGWSPYFTRSYRALFGVAIPVSYRMRHYAPREYLRLLEPIGIVSSDTAKHLAFSSVAEKKVMEFFAEQKIAFSERGMMEQRIIEQGMPRGDFLVAISPSAGNKVKKWGGNKFAEVADYLHLSYGAQVIIIGGKNDRQEVAEMMRHVKTPVINAGEKFTVEELKALISRMNLFVAVDTGPVYIAEAFGVPTVDITGPVDENEQPPIGPLHRVVHIQDRKSPELFVMNASVYNKAEALRQSEAVTVGMVVKEIDEVCRLLGIKKIS